jgi:dCMP deaminase
METSYTPEYYRRKQLERDIYYLKIAKTVSSRSKCLSRKIGSVLVKGDSIIGSGFNGPAKGVKHCNERPSSFYSELVGEKPIENEEKVFFTECPRRILHYTSGQGLFLCQAGHAERNALIQAARNGVSTKDSVLYCWCEQVCKDCAIEIVNAGVKELVYLKSDKPYDGYANTILEESGMIIREIEESLVC